MTPVSLVWKALAEKGLQFPFPLSLAMKGLYLGHSVWWVNQKRKLASDSSNFLALGGGILLNRAIGNGPLRLGIRLLFIISRIEALVCCALSWKKEWENLLHLCRGSYWIYVEPQWSKNSRKKFLSPSLRNEGRGQKELWRANLPRLCRCAFSVFVQKPTEFTFCCLDAYFAFYADDEAVIEAGLHGIRWLKALKKNKNYFIYKLQANKGLIKTLLDGVGAPFSAEQAIQGFTVALEANERLVDCVIDPASRVFGEKTIKFMKDSLVNLAAAFNKTEWVPDVLIS